MCHGKLLVRAIRCYGCNTLGESTRLPTHVIIRLLTHSLTHSLTLSPFHSLTRSFTYLFTLSPFHSLTHSRTHFLTPTHSRTHFLTPTPPTHPLTHPPTHTYQGGHELGASSTQWVTKGERTSVDIQFAIAGIARGKEGMCACACACACARAYMRACVRVCACVHVCVYVEGCVLKMCVWNLV